MEETLKRFIESNRKSRDSASGRVQRLTAALHGATTSDYRETVEEVLHESATAPESVVVDQPESD